MHASANINPKTGTRACRLFNSVNFRKYSILWQLKKSIDDQSKLRCKIPM